MENCSIIITNYNQKSYLKNCIDSILKNTYYKDYKIIIVDNNSTDGSKEMIKDTYSDIDIIEDHNSYLMARLWNIGINYSIEKYNPDYFYLLNNDTLVKPYWLREAIKTMKKDTAIGIVGSKQLSFGNKSSISSGWIKMFGVEYYYGDEEKEVNWVSGAGFLVKKEVIKSIGLFDEIYYPAYYEETDFDKRAIINGFKIIHCPKSIFLHKGGASTKKSKINYKEFHYKNRIIYFLKYYSWLYFMPRLINDILKGLKNKELNIVLSGYRKGMVDRKMNGK